MLKKEQIRAIQKSISAENDQMPLLLNALGDPGRYRIFKILIKHHDICVTEISTILGITVSAASQQLRILERIGLIRKNRMGQMICYELRNDNPFVQLLCTVVVNNYT
jgi:ArsR family transcriptional regulator, lead/cadmium/zinc/bismuth-responsive transcriptional repressor